MNAFKLFPFCYGSRLLSPAGSLWMTMVSIFMVAMCVIEGLAWAVAASSILGSEYARTATAIGVMFGALIYCLDLGLVTIDFRSLRMGKIIVSILARLALVSIGAYFTAPILGGYFLEDEIVTAISDRNAVLKNEFVVAENERLDELVEGKRQSWNAARQAYTDEMRGRDGRPRGNGPVAKQLKLLLDEARADIERAEISRTQTLERIRRADNETLMTEFGVRLVADAFETRAAMQEDMSAEAGGWTESEALASLMIGMIWCGMVLAKVAQPGTIYDYYDEVLQSAFARYLRGGYDHALPERQRNDGKSAFKDAGDFGKWYYDHQEDVEVREQELRAAKELDDTTTRMQRNRQRLQELDAEDAELAAELNAAREETCNIVSEAQHVQRCLDDAQEDLKAINASLERGLERRAAREMIELKSKTEADIAALSQRFDQVSPQAKDLQDKQNDLAKRLDRVRLEVHNLKATLDSCWERAAGIAVDLDGNDSVVALESARV